MKVVKVLRTWIKENRLEAAIIFGIILLAFLLRVYRIDGYMTFLGDEGRDMLVMKKIWVEKDLPFIGPPTSVGNMYLGPLYYYMMAIPTGIFWMNPVAAAVMVSVIGTMTVGFIYYLSRLWFGKIAAITASLLYTLSPVAIIYGRSSWNPNPAPFFALLSLFGIYKVHRTGNMNWLIVTGIGLAFAVQMHYLALILIPIMGILWIWELYVYYKNYKSYNYYNFWSGTLFAILAFLLLMSPLFIFDLKHNFPNYRALMTLINSDESSVNASISETMLKFFPIYVDKLIGRYFAVIGTWFAPIVSVLVIAPLIWVAVLKITGKRLRWPFLGLAVYLLIGLLGLTFYKNEIYDHYIGFLSPAPFLLIGSLVGLIWELKNKNLRYGLVSIFLLFIGGIFSYMIYRSPLQYEPNNQLTRTQTIAREVLDNTENKPYNFALIAKSNYDAAYQFYLEQYGRKPGLLPFEKTDQLFVVCEDSECLPVGHPKYEIAAFGMSKIEWVKDFQGVKLYKLIANPTGIPQ